jgi:hypothetical protein
MSETPTYPLRLPKSLKDEVVKVAKRDGTSVNQFIAMAVAEKIPLWKLYNFSVLLSQTQQGIILATVKRSGHAAKP